MIISIIYKIFNLLFFVNTKYYLPFMNKYLLNNNIFSIIKLLKENLLMYIDKEFQLIYFYLFVKVY